MIWCTQERDKEIQVSAFLLEGGERFAGRLVGFYSLLCSFGTQGKASGKPGMGLYVTAGNSQFCHLNSVQASLSDLNSHIEPIFARTHTDQNQIDISSSVVFPPELLAICIRHSVVNIKTTLPLCSPFLPWLLSVALSPSSYLSLTLYTLHLDFSSGCTGACNSGHHRAHCELTA